ncbi:MAG: hypothetical protein ACR2GA_04180 [Chloroflexota bacterium]
MTSINRKTPFEVRRATPTRRRSAHALVGLVTILALAVPLRQGGATVAAAQATGTSGSVTTSTAVRTATVDLRTLPKGAAAVRTGAAHNIALPYLRPYRQTSAAIASAAPRASSTSGNASAVDTTILHNFLGLDSIDSFKVNAGDVEPPDQGLCVGPLGTSGTTGQLEMVNLAVALYNTSGSVLLGPVGLNSFFGEPTAGFSGSGGENTSDPRCYYDPTSRSLFATIIAYSFNSMGIAESHVDLAVDATPPGAPVNLAGPWNIYRINTSDTSDPGCPCLADQPLLGVDSNGVYISTNEFTQPLTGFNGAQLYAISKAQLLSGAASPRVVHYGHLTIPGDFPAASLEPAQSPNGASAEYFLNSLDPNATIDNRIGVWVLGDTARLNTGGTPPLSHVIIQSETYGQPPNALQKGSSATLATDDDRMLQVQFVNGNLWSSLNSVVLINGDTESRSGAAWFRVAPSLSGSAIRSARIVEQGYVTYKGNYILYPAIAVDNNNNAAMAFTLSGPSFYPSAAYATGSHFSTLKTAALGTQPDHGFTCNAPYGPPCRWGDYSAAARDPLNGNVWLATEYIANSGDVYANWATRVFDVTPYGG